MNKIPEHFPRVNILNKLVYNLLTMYIGYSQLLPKPAFE